jgi:hypothetical protein
MLMESISILHPSSNGNSKSSSFCCSSKVNPYWNPLQPPPWTKVLSISCGFCSSFNNWIILFFALSVMSIIVIFIKGFYNLNANKYPMYTGSRKEKHRYHRTSKTGVVHEYHRQRTVLEFRCDDCGREFSRHKGAMDPKRLNNSYFHVCENCDAKKFAQKKSVEKYKVWDLKASSLEDISKI